MKKNDLFFLLGAAATTYVVLKYVWNPFKKNVSSMTDAQLYAEFEVLYKKISSDSYKPTKSESTRFDELLKEANRRGVYISYVERASGKKIG